MPKELRQQKTFSTAANAGNDLHGAVMLRENQLAEVQIFIIMPRVYQACGLVNMPTLKLVRNLTYFNVRLSPDQKHFTVKSGLRTGLFGKNSGLTCLPPNLSPAGPPKLSQPGVCQVAL